MALKNLKVTLLTGVTVLSLSACGWLQEDVSNGSYNRWESSAADVPAPPATRVMQTAEGTWLQPDTTPRPVPTATELAELKSANKRIAELETQIASLQNDMQMMMPALTRLANNVPVNVPVNAPVEAMALNDIQPAAGNIAGGEVPRIHRDYMQGQDVFGDAEMYGDPEAAIDQPIVDQQTQTQQPLPVAPPPPPVVQAAPAPEASPSVATASPQGMVPGAPVAVSPKAAPIIPPAVAPVPPTLQPAVAPPPVQVVPAAYTPPPINVSSIQGIRFGNHEGGKSRMVLDVSAASSFKFDIDNNEKFLVIEVPGTVWNAGPVTRMIQDNPLLQSVAASPDGQGGTRLVFQLKAPVKILWSQAIPPAGGQGHRLVFDVAAL